MPIQGRGGIEGMTVASTVAVYLPAGIGIAEPKRNDRPCR